MYEAFHIFDLYVLICAAPNFLQLWPRDSRKFHADTAGLAQLSRHQQADSSSPCHLAGNASPASLGCVALDTAQAAMKASGTVMTAGGS
jgi:hypothetical protein